MTETTASSTRPAPQVHYSTFRKSSGYVATGAAMSVLGALLAVVGMISNATSYSGDDGAEVLVVGAIVGLVGVAAFLFGAVQAAKNIDLAAQVASDVLMQQALAQYDEPEPEARPMRSYHPQSGDGEPSTGEIPTRRSRRDA